MRETWAVPVTGTKIDATEVAVVPKVAAPGSLGLIGTTLSKLHGPSTIGRTER